MAEDDTVIVRVEIPNSPGQFARLTEVDAFTARIHLIHHYRRVVMRDPLLRTALLPSDWPRHRCSRQQP